MKYFLRVLLVLVLAVAAVLGSYYYTTGKTISSGTSQSDLTTVTKPPATEKNAGRVLLASLKKRNIFLYKNGDTIILTQDNKTYEFTNWSRYFDTEKPKLYYRDFDHDGERELLIRAVDYIVDETNQNAYALYFLDPVVNSDGEEDLEVTLLSRSFYSKILSESIVEEITQLKTCHKTGQFAMNFASKGIHYDKKTGLTTDEHAGYFSVLQDDNGEYLTIDTWSKGIGNYYIDDDNVINLEIDIYVNYKDSDLVQNAGKIKMKLDKNTDSSFFIAQKTLVFEADDKYAVADPTIVNTEKWVYLENNSNKSTQNNGDLVIDWLRYDTKFKPSINTQTVDFDSIGDVKGLKSIEISDSQLVLTAKEAYTFDTSYSNGRFAVILNDKYDISYTASLSVEDNIQIVTIQFDRSYGKEEIESLSISYGAK